MVVLSLLPIGILQALASIEHGLWYARSDVFMQQPLIELLRWGRLIGDSLFLAGVVALAWFVAGLKFGWSFQPEAEREAGEQWEAARQGA